MTDLRCNYCNQPLVRTAHSMADGHRDISECIKAVARRCAEIAAECTFSTPKEIAGLIRAEFGVKP